MYGYDVVFFLGGGVFIDCERCDCEQYMKRVSTNRVCGCPLEIIQYIQCDISHDK